jgi:hypothetical protein
MDRQHLINKIEQFSDASGLKPSTICQYAVLNGRFYDNLVSGRDYQIGTAQRLIDWIDSQGSQAGDT